MLLCISYLSLTGLTMFILGRLLPKQWFRGDLFPYRSFAFEKRGTIYNRLHIKAWQSKVPDMSRILPNLMPGKRLSADYREQLPRMVQETCIAELTHFVLCLTGLYCMKLWRGMGGFILSILNLLGNAVFIIIQRYNRPRLMCLQKSAARKHCLEEISCAF